VGVIFYVNAGPTPGRPPSKNNRVAEEEEAMTALEQQLLAALQLLERHYSERDTAMMQRLQTLTARVDALSGQVEQLAQALRQLTRGTG
jgi:tRNA C32,U32 (ribose-2'-O)-methylase TrmJ